MLVGGIKYSMKGIDGIPFDDIKTVIHIAFPYLRLYFRGVDGHFFDHFHAEICHHRADGATHRTAMGLFVYLVIINKVVVGQDKVQQCNDFIAFQAGA